MSDAWFAVALSMIALGVLWMRDYVTGRGGYYSFCLGSIAIGAGGTGLLMWVAFKTL